MKTLLNEHEHEKASNSYLMSLVAIIGGLPLPIINLLATLFFYLNHRNDSYFVRWHCTQALFSQIPLVLLNTITFWWTMSIIFGNNFITNLYVGYVISVIIFNIIEFVATIYTIIQVRKGIHITWWFYGPLTNLICKIKV